MTKNLTEWPAAFKRKGVEDLLATLERNATTRLTPVSSSFSDVAQRSGKMFLVRRKNGRSDKNIAVAAYPSAVDLPRFIAMQNPDAGLFVTGGPSETFPGSIGVLTYSPSNSGDHLLINFVQGNFSLQKENAALLRGDALKRDELKLDRKFFGRYADWRVRLFQHAIEHALEMNRPIHFNLSANDVRCFASGERRVLPETAINQLKADFKVACDRAGADFERQGSMLIAKPTE